MEGWLAQIVNWINQLIWGFPALLLILGAGLYFTCRLGFLPIRRLPMALGNLGRRLRQPPEDGVSPFQAVCTALAATVGTGNIAGVAGAIALGGPGAVFWMWIAALLGMSLKYAEAVLAVRYRQPRPNGQFAGGPMYYMEQGLGKTWRPLAVAYCCFGVAAAFGVGNSTQVSAAVTSMNQALAAFQIPETFAGNLTMGLILGLLVGLVVLGGAKRIGSVAEYLIPVVCLGYVLLGVGALIHNRQALPQALASIAAGAFSPRAVTGGAIGSLLVTLRIGVARGVFTNEAGMGTASIAHAGANVRHPAEQGLYGIFEVFADTLVICTMTRPGNPHLRRAGALRPGCRGRAYRGRLRLRLRQRRRRIPGHCHGAAGLCHHPGVGAVRQPLCRIPAGRQGREAVCHCPCRHHRVGRVGCPVPAVEPGGSLKRPDGRAKLDCPVGPQPGGDPAEPGLFFPYSDRKKACRFIRRTR